ncbi:MAG: Histidine kinase [Labilithrix sp.]|nr:Histidine kinase [Labilithrix sp.]
MNATKRDRATFALRGKALMERVRAFSVDLETRRAAAPHLPWSVTDLTGDASNVSQVLQELEVRGEELSVAEEELRAQLDELIALNESLHLEQQRHRELFDFSPDPLVVTDALTTTVRAANSAAAATLGIDQACVVRRPLTSFLDASTAATLRSRVFALKPGDATVLEAEFAPEGRSPVSVELRGFRSIEGDRIIWSAHDITERRLRQERLLEANAGLEQHVAARTRELQRALRDKEDLLQRERDLRAELETANRAKDRFLAILSHDLRSPLNAVLGWTSLLRREILDHASRDRALATIERNARVQAELIEQLLDVSRITAGQLPLEMRGVALGSVVKSAVEAMLPAASAKGVTLVDKNLGELDSTVLGDVGRLRQVVSNLLTNAVKFTPAGGKVSIGVSLADERVVLTVRDTGSGIAPETLPQVFDVFRQLGDPGMNRDGLGLGLFIVKQIVELHGGDVVAASDGPGTGATFTVTLPRRVAGSVRSLTPPPGLFTSNEEPAPGSDDLIDLRGLKILLVEDDVDTRELLTLALERRGARVVCTADAETGLEAYRTLLPDVVLSDVGLPIASGNDLLRSIRTFETSEARARVPAVAISGFASSADAKVAFTAGFDAHIGKPLVPADVLRVVARLAATRARPLKRS